jgi:hypothetical protein
LKIKNPKGRKNMIKLKKGLWIYFITVNGDKVKISRASKTQKEETIDLSYSRFEKILDGETFKFSESSRGRGISFTSEEIQEIKKNLGSEKHTDTPKEKPSILDVSDFLRALISLLSNTNALLREQLAINREIQLLLVDKGTNTNVPLDTTPGNMVQIVPPTKPDNSQSPKQQKSTESPVKSSTLKILNQIQVLNYEIFKCYNTETSNAEIRIKTMLAKPDDWTIIIFCRELEDFIWKFQKNRNYQTEHICFDGDSIMIKQKTTVWIPINELEKIRAAFDLAPEQKPFPAPISPNVILTTSNPGLNSNGSRRATFVETQIALNHVDNHSPDVTINQINFWTKHDFDNKIIFLSIPKERLGSQTQPKYRSTFVAQVTKMSISMILDRMCAILNGTPENNPDRIIHHFKIDNLKLYYHNPAHPTYKNPIFFLILIKTL